MSRITVEFGSSHGVVFLDEIQRKEDAGLFLKGLYDMHLPYKLVVSGSGSVELKEKVHESLLGRKQLFELLTVSFLEFAHFRTDYRYESNLEEFFAIDPSTGERLMEEYLSFGGYPRVVLEETFEDKQRIINEIYRSYIEKDIAYLLRIDRVDAFSALMKILASQVGQLLNYSELSRTLDISLPTIKKYIWYAEKTFSIEHIAPFFRNTRKELTQSPMVYFLDLGMRNYAVGVFGLPKEAQSDRGFLFQNAVYRLLKEGVGFSGSTIHFWRTKSKAEVDFVIERGAHILPVEVKYTRMKKTKIELSLRSFIKKYKPKRAYVVTIDLDSTVRYEDTTVIFIPFWKAGNSMREYMYPTQ
ncbi:MAG: ATP-binding protein [bacterium]|nr:ATP-binding protein [bacterium]